MTSSLQQRVRAVPAPPPVLDREGEAALTDRQREILDELGTIFNKGFVELTMADLAAALNCSLRTLYGLAQSRNELVLMVLDRNLRKIGRAAHAAVDDDMSGLDAVRAYLSAGNTAVADVTPELGADMAVVAGGLEMWEAHEEYLISVTAALLDGAVADGEIAPVDTAAVARMIGSMGHEFSRPEVMPQLQRPPQESADAMVDIVLAGLRAGGTPKGSTP
jgi:AcrR family transcriptional regulator